MKTVLIKARYVDQFDLEAILGHIFRGHAQVMWSRGYFECVVPRGLKQYELDAIGQTIELQHYSELTTSHGGQQILR
jgi:hypothetical protein